MNTPESSKAWSAPLLGVIAATIGLAAVRADDIPFDLLKSCIALLLAGPAYLGFLRTVRRVGAGGTPQMEFITAIVLPALFLLFLATATDHYLRGEWSWIAFASALPFVLLATNVSLCECFLRRSAELENGHPTLATTITPETAKLWLVGSALPAYMWLVLQIGREALPHGCAFAAITLILSLQAIRLLDEDPHDPPFLLRALRLSTFAALGHGAIIASTLMLSNYWLLLGQI